MSKGIRVLFTRYTMTSAHLSIIPEFLEKIGLLGFEETFNINKSEVVNAKNKSDILDFKKVKFLLLIIAFLAVVFIIGQVIAWRQLIAQGYFFNSNIANSYFYLFTTLHVLHLVGGLFFLKKATQKVYNENIRAPSIQSSVKLCGIYWHFLFLVWVVLFGLMINS